jgi:hypothetical protein
MDRNADEWELMCAVDRFDHPVTEGLKSDFHYGSDNHTGPIFFADDPNATVLGHLIFNKGRWRPGLVVKEMDGHKAIWSGAPNIPADLLRNIARWAGVHIFSESNDVQYFNRDFIMLHTMQGGRKHIWLPKQADVFDVFNDRIVARGVEEFTDEVEACTTTLYHYGDVDAFRRAVSELK